MEVKEVTVQQLQERLGALVQIKEQAEAVIELTDQEMEEIEDEFKRRGREPRAWLQEELKAWDLQNLREECAYLIGLQARSEWFEEADAEALRWVQVELARRE